nr:hypothetical protein [Natrialba hulunbeirensis]
MVNDLHRSGNGHLQFTHGDRTGSDGRRFDVPRGFAQEITVTVESAEDVPDRVHGAVEVRTTVGKVQANRLADFGVHWPLRSILGDSVRFPVEDDVRWVFRGPSVVIVRVVAFFTGVAVGVEFVLAEVELAVDLGKPVRGFDEDGSEHPRTDVVVHVGDGTVVDVGTRKVHLCREGCFLVTGSERRVFGSATRTVHRVEVDVVRVHVRLLGNAEREVDRVPLANADHRTGNLPFERHEVEGDARFDFRDVFRTLDGDVVFAWLVPVDRRWNVLRVGCDRVHIDRFGGGEPLGIVVRRLTINVSGVFVGYATCNCSDASCAQYLQHASSV